MLHAMGVRVWQPMLPPADLQNATESIATQANTANTSVDFGNESAARQATTAARRPAVLTVPATSENIAPALAGGAPECWRLGLAQPLYANADAQPAGGVRWLVLAQAPPAALDAPAFDGDAGRLLANMLHAARLPKEAGAVIFAPLVRQAISGPMDAFSAALSALISQARPDIVLIMGRLAGQALLASSEPFGKLRGRPHVLQGHAAVVTYDAPYLLRCPLDKARAWDDLCLAMGLAQRRA